MKVLIIEDEKPAAEKLTRLLQKYDSHIEIVAILSSIKQSLKWLEENTDSPIQLIFSDIQLTDGLSFEIFKQFPVNKPIIFTTAFNEYAIEAFKVNGIDYLLKPITFSDLSNSLQKLDKLKETLQSAAPTPDLNQLSKMLSNLHKNYKTRFMVKLGEHIHSITTDKIPLFYAEGRNAFLLTQQNRKFVIDYKLEELEDVLDPMLFFRVNRSYIVNINAITDVLMYSNSRLKISLDTSFDKEIIVSREKVTVFKNWFNGL